MPRYFVSMYTDGPSTRWNVIDRQTQEWVRRFPTEAEAQAYADSLSHVQNDSPFCVNDPRVICPGGAECCEDDDE